MFFYPSSKPFLFLNSLCFKNGAIVSKNKTLFVLMLSAHAALSSRDLNQGMEEAKLLDNYSILAF